MNNTFNIKRFGLLIKRHWLEYGKIQLITLAIVTGLILALYGFAYIDIVKSTVSNSSQMSRNLRLNFREPLFIILGILFITFAANQHFATLGQKPKAIIELTLPASTFEKFLVGLFFSVFLTILTYLFIFYLVDLAFVSMLINMFHQVTVEKYFTDGLREVVTKNIHPVYFFQKNLHLTPKPFYVIPFFISSIFLLGSIYFSKSHFVKTTIAIMVFLGLWITYLIYTGKAIFDDMIRIQSNDTIIYDDKGEWGVTIILIVISLIFWVITYVRLREKEV